MTHDQTDVAVVDWTPVPVSGKRWYSGISEDLPLLQPCYHIRRNHCVACILAAIENTLQTYYVVVAVDIDVAVASSFVDVVVADAASTVVAVFVVVASSFAAAFVVAVDIADDDVAAVVAVEDLHKGEAQCQCNYFCCSDSPYYCCCCCSQSYNCLHFGHYDHCNHQSLGWTGSEAGGQRCKMRSSA